MIEQNTKPAEPEQADFTLNEFVVIYEGMNRDGFKFDGTDKVVTSDPGSAALRVIEGIVSRDPQIGHIRVNEVQMPASGDFVKFFDRNDPWPPNPKDGPCLSPAPKPFDARMVKAFVQVEKRTMTTKDGTETLQLVLRIYGSQAIAAERELLSFRSSEQKLMTIVASQADFVGDLDPAGENEDKTATAVVSPDGAITPLDSDDLDEDEDDAEDDEEDI